MAGSDADAILFEKGADGIYRPSKGAQAVSELVSDENGKILVRGLDAGSYILKETKAPAGFSLPENPETPVILTDDYAVKENQPAEAGMDGLLEITETETDAEGNETEKIVYTLKPYFSRNRSTPRASSSSCVFF